MLTDTGPLVSLINRNDVDHTSCAQVLLSQTTQPLATTLPCVTEAMYLLHRMGGSSFQAELWKMIDNGRVVIIEIDELDLRRMQELMTKYGDRPMDFADASIVAAAEKFKFERVFSLDSDFYIYRLEDGSALEVLPAASTP